MSGGRSTACARSSRRSRNCSSSGSGSVPMSGRPHRLPERCERAVEVHPHRCLRALQHRRDLRRRQLLLYLKDHGRALLRREPAHGLPEPLQRPLPSDRVHGVLGGGGLAVEEGLPRLRGPPPPRPQLPAPRPERRRGGAPGHPPASTPPALLPVRLARLVDVTPQVATIATEVAGILAAILLVRLEILALLFDVLEIRLHCVLVTGLAILVELPPVLPEVAPVLPDVPRVLSDVLPISTNVSPVLRHVPVRSELTAVLAETAPR